MIERRTISTVLGFPILPKCKLPLNDVFVRGGHITYCRDARLEQLKRLPTDPVIVVVEVFRARVTLGAEM